MYAARQHHARQLIRIVTHHFALFKQVRADDFTVARSVSAGPRLSPGYLERAVSRVQGGLVPGDTTVILQHVIKLNLRSVLLNGRKMFLRVEAVGLSGLRHQVSNEDFGSR